MVTVLLSGLAHSICDRFSLLGSQAGSSQLPCARMGIEHAVMLSRHRPDIPTRPAPIVADMAPEPA